MFYAEFVDLVATRSHRDVVNNFLDALPSNVRMMVLMKSGIQDEVFNTPLDDLFHCAKRMFDLVSQSGEGQAPGVNVVTTGEEVGDDQVWLMIPKHAKGIDHFLIISFGNLIILEVTKTTRGVLIKPVDVSA